MTKKYWAALIPGVIGVFVLLLLIVPELLPHDTSNPHDSSNLPFTAPRVTIENEGEYLTFLSTEKELPEDFVTAQMLSCIGPFYNFSCEKDFTEYRYNVITFDEVDMMIYVNHGKSPDPSKDPILDAKYLGNDNIYALTTDVAGAIWLDGMRYNYVQGKILSVRWYIEDIEFILSFSGDAWNNPAWQNNPFLCDLLSAESAKRIRAFNTLVQCIEDNPHIAE